MKSERGGKDVKTGYLPENLSIAEMYRMSWVESEKELPIREVWCLLISIGRTIQFEVPTT